MGQFINDKEQIVTQAIDGLLRNHNGELKRLDGYPHIKVVTRADWTPTRVAVISGGGSGHEPSHAGFVGEGLLTAAVCGEVFASPSVDAVLAGILAVTGDPGCLLIVKNYTGDRLNFGLAAERARALGHKVEMVIVGDDVAIPDIPQPRGVAGTLFVHKIAGALAASGASLEVVAETASRVARHTVSLGMSLDTCTVPGAEKEDRIASGMAELGLGIHGEPGIEQVAYSHAQAAIDLVTERLEPCASHGDLVVLFNNLGGCTPLEMGILVDSLHNSRMGHRIRWMVGPAPLMTSLDMRGFSISLYAPTTDDLKSLKSDVGPGNWPGCRDVGSAEIAVLPEDIRPVPMDPSNHAPTQQLIKRCCQVLIDNARQLNELDAKSGDGDTGSTLETAARALQRRLDRLPLADPAKLFHAISQELSQSMGGSSGVLLAIFFAAAGDTAKGGRGVQTAFSAGLERIKQVGGAEVGDRTMIDALDPAIASLGHGMCAAAKAARKGADATSRITRAGAGRASYLAAASLAGHNDPGAEAVAILFEALADD